MSDRKAGEGPHDDADSERALERLFAHAQPRPMPPAADTEEIRRAVLAEWEAATGKRVRLRRAGFAAAASLVLGLAWWVGLAPGPGVAPPAMAATVERVEGRVASAGGTALAAGSGLAVGDTVVTGAGQVALRLATGGSLRIAPQSRVALSAANAADLVAGALYFDSEQQRPGANFTVVTGLGSVRDVGTQFFVRLDDAAGRLDVGVRDGRVELTRGPATDTAGVGERLVVVEDGAEIRRSTMPTFGSEWEWAERLAPAFDIDGRTVSEFLEWFTTQTGRTVVFGSPAAERQARDAVLRGSIDLAPMQKLQAVLATTDLLYTLEGERVVVETR
jgi:hypothetical protein